MNMKPTAHINIDVRAPESVTQRSLAIGILAFLCAFVVLACDSQPDPRPDLYSPATGTGGTNGSYIAEVNNPVAGTDGSYTTPTTIVSGASGSTSTVTPPTTVTQTTAICGDNIITNPEQCEGPNLNGMTCDKLGAGTGQLACNPVTCQYDTSKCPSLPVQPNTAGSSGSVGTAGAAGAAGTIIELAGTGGSTPPTPVCTPNTSETESCGTCGEKTRQCLADGSDWGQWSECVDDCANLPPQCSGVTQSPTWNNGVSDVIRGNCAVCHASEANSYRTVMSWRNFDRYVQMNHFIAPPDTNLVLCWIALGKPEN